MKNAVLVAALCSLVACGDDANETGAPTAAAITDDPGAMTLAADGNPSAGSYRVVDQDGVVLLEELRPDGTYVFSDESGAATEEGSWTQKSPSELCFTADTKDAAEICYREVIGADGRWISTNTQSGETATIERLTE